MATLQDKLIFVLFMRCLYHIIVCLFLFVNKSHAQLNSSGETDPAIENILLERDSSVIHVGCFEKGREFTIVTKNQGIWFVPGKYNPFDSLKGILIAPAKNSRCTGIACNQLAPANPERIYVCWDDEKFYGGDSDVFLSYSDDNGLTWTEPILVTYHPNHKAQFTPGIAVDDNGYVYLLYFDRQNSPDNKHTDIYLAVSKNGGLKFDYYRVNSKALKSGYHNPPSFLYAKPVIVTWTEKGKRVYAVEIKDSILNAYNVSKAKEAIQIKRSFTFSDTIRISFSVHKNSKISAIITKPLEPGFEKVILKNKHFKKGDAYFLIDTKKTGLKKGNYTLTLYDGSNNTYVWIMDED